MFNDPTAIVAHIRETGSGNRWITVSLGYQRYAFASVQYIALLP